MDGEGAVKRVTFDLVRKKESLEKMAGESLERQSQREEDRRWKEERVHVREGDILLKEGKIRKGGEKETGKAGSKEG